MSDWVMDLARHANTQFVWLKLQSDGAGANLFVNDLPDSPDEAVGFFRYGGEAPDELFGNPIVKRNPRMQAMIRDPFSEVSVDRAEQLMKFLGVVTEQQIGDTYFHLVRPVGELTELGPDSARRERVTVNFRVEIRGAG